MVTYSDVESVFSDVESVFLYSSDREVWASYTKLTFSDQPRRRFRNEEAGSQAEGGQEGREGSHHPPGHQGPEDVDDEAAHQVEDPESRPESCPPNWWGDFTHVHLQS